MKHTIVITLAVAMTAAFGGCLLTGQITLFEDVDVGASTNTSFNAYLVDLNENEDYADNKDKIKSVDGISFVAVVENKTTTPAKAAFYISDDPTINTVDDLKDPNKATLVFVSPTVPGDSKILIDWEDGFAHMVNEQAVIDQVLGDGMFAIYGIADDTPFNLYIKGEVSVTLTVGK